MKGDCWIRDEARSGWLRFRNPLEIVVARSVPEVASALVRVERLVEERSLHAAGFLSYESSPAFDGAFRTHPPSDLPLLWFGLFREPEPGPLPSSSAARPFDAGPWAPEIERPDYDLAIRRIRERIARGETYQANYTFRLRAPFAGDDYSFFLRLVSAQGPALGAYVDAGRFAVCSASPELFFRLDGERLVSRPMKGTAARACTLAEDEARAADLFRSEKERAENVMIVDMVRSDMGRVAPPGGVRVARLLDVEKYPTVWQLTSTVEATTASPISEIFGALFPCASVTGAPKVRTMRILAEEERSARGVYTGAVGFVSPGRRASFNVAIRTAVVDRERRSAEYGVGGGITWDSDPAAEHDECLAKARVLSEGRPEFSLLETILWTPGHGYFLLGPHLARLQGSARYFDHPFAEEAALRELEALAASFAGSPRRVRLLLGPDGGMRLQSADHAPPAGPAPLALAAEPVDASDPFLYHKTTHRGAYERARASVPDGVEALLWNRRGEITEAETANVLVKIGGRTVTPPVSCGLLAGTYRGYLLDRGEISEEIVRVDDLVRATRVDLVNSVAGRREARLLRRP